MCDLVENYAKKKAAAVKVAEEAIEKEKNTALRLFQNRVSYEVVRASIISLSDEDLQELYRKAKE